MGNCREVTSPVSGCFRFEVTSCGEIRALAGTKTGADDRAAQGGLARQNLWHVTRTEGTSGTVPELVFGEEIGLENIKR